MRSTRLALLAIALAAATQSASGSELQRKGIRGAEAIADSLAALPSFFAKSPPAGAAAQQLSAQAAERGDMSRLIEGAEARISAKVIQQLARQTIEQQMPVNEEMLGVPLTGRAHLKGATAVELVENPERGTFDLLLIGTIVSTTVGDGGKARVHTRTVTRFAARKRILLDEHGLTALPARCNARSSATLLGMSTPLPGLRGRLVRRVGWQRAQDSLPQAEQIAAQRAADRICRNLDQQTELQLAQANRLFQEQIQQLAAAQKGATAPLKFCTTRTHLVARGLRTQPAKLPVPAAVKKLEKEVAALVVLPAAALDWATASRLAANLSENGKASLVSLTRKVLPPDLAKLIDEQDVLSDSGYQVHLAVDQGRLVMALLASGD